MFCFYGNFLAFDKAIQLTILDQCCRLGLMALHLIVKRAPSLTASTRSVKNNLFDVHVCCRSIVSRWIVLTQDKYVFISCFGHVASFRSFLRKNRWPLEHLFVFWNSFFVSRCDFRSMSSLAPHVSAPLKIQFSPENIFTLKVVLF